MAEIQSLSLLSSIYFYKGYIYDSGALYLFQKWKICKDDFNGATITIYTYAQTVPKSNTSDMPPRF